MGLRRSLIRLILVRPWLLPHALGLAWAVRARGWYRRPPFLPLPSSSYLKWRMDTAYGGADGEPTTEELARYLRWASRMRRLR